MDYPIYELIINEDLNDDAEVSLVSFVDRPAIQRLFNKFNDEFINPSKGEHKTEFLPRCISYVINEGKESAQAVAICNSLWDMHFAGQKVSYDYDDTLSTKIGKELAKESIDNGDVVYIISARQDKEAMLGTADELGIPHSRVYATGSNKAKVEKIKELDINKHIDNNIDVIKELGSIGSKFAEDSYNDYPEEAKNNAKRALDYADKNGWGSCGEATGKIRANQIANGENLTRETIARISGFRRHQQNKDVPYTEGCGGLMWDAWGGDAMINWAEKKLRQIDKQNFVVQSEEKRIISGVIMLSDTPIYRNDSANGEYYVVFSKDTIYKIVQKFFKKGFQSNVNLQHNAKDKVSGVTMFESFISDKDRGILPMKGFEDTPDGSWFGSFKVDDDNVWEMVKNGEIKGFSVEGVFEYTRKESKEEQLLSDIKKILSSISDK